MQKAADTGNSVKGQKTSVSGQKESLLFRILAEVSLI